MNNKLYCALGYACNSNCRICVVDSKVRESQNLSTDEVIQFFKMTLDKNNISEVEFSGGEPTIRTDLPKLLDYLMTHHPKIAYTILSNGMCFSDIWYAGEFANRPIKNIIIALHGHTPKLHDWQTRTPGSFKKTTKGIQNLLDFGINVTLKIIPTKKNYKNIPKIVEYVIINFPKIRHLTFNGLDIRGQALQNKEDVAIRFSDAIAFIQSGIDKATNVGIKTSTYSIPPCTLSEGYRSYVGDQREAIATYKSPLHEINNKREAHGVTEKCAHCTYISTCSGAWNSYFNVMGFDDIKPIKSEEKSETVIRVNGSCNNACMFCSVGGSRTLHDSTKYEVLQKITSLNVKRSSTIILSGGEPTLQEGIIDIVRQLRNRGHKIKIITNGRNFSDITFAKNIAAAGLSEVITEIHSHIPEVHDFITQRIGSFNETLEGVHNLIRCGICVKIKLLLNRINYKTLPQTVEFVCKNITQTDSISITAINLCGTALVNKNLLGIRFSDAAHYVEKSLDIANNLNMNIALCAFPICALHPKYSHHSALRKPHGFYDAGQYLDMKKYMPHVCCSCSYSAKCTGIWKSQIDVFGENEIKPLTRQ